MLLHALLSEADADDGASGVLDKLSKELAVVSDILSGAADGQGLGVQIILDRETGDAVKNVSPVFLVGAVLFL